MIDILCIFYQCIAPWETGKWLLHADELPWTANRRLQATLNYHFSYTFRKPLFTPSSHSIFNDLLVSLPWKHSPHLINCLINYQLISWSKKKNQFTPHFRTIKHGLTCKLCFTLQHNWTKVTALQSQLLKQYYNCKTKRLTKSHHLS